MDEEADASRSVDVMNRWQHECDVAFGAVGEAAALAPIWDQAAGALLIEEAGGRVTDRHGEPLDFACGRTLARNVGIIASNGRLHEAVIDALRTRGVVSDA